MLSSGRVVGYDEIASIRLDEAAAAGGDRRTGRWTDRVELTPGRRYAYVVTAIDSTGRSSAPSERLVVDFVASPGVPRDLASAVGDARVTLRWQRPEAAADGSPLTGEVRYVVLRGAEAEAAPVTPVNAEPTAATELTDTGVANDTTYRFAVRAIRIAPGGVRAYGEASAAVSATPVDTTPPAPPAELVAIPTAGSVRLAWRPSPEADVALYAIYRAIGEGALVRVGTTAAINTVFIDREVTPGTTYRYAVTALDRARRANESGRSNEVRVQAE
jgi:hypothetical protein